MSFNNNDSYVLSHIAIENLWGKYNISSVLDENVNIFIGINGSFKTTIIKLIYNLLTVNIKGLLDVEFSRLELKLKNGEDFKTVKFYMEDANLKKYIYEISGIGNFSFTERDFNVSKEFFEDDFEAEYQYYVSDDIGTTRTKTRAFKNYFSIKKELENLINIDYLNISRNNSVRHRRYSRDEILAVDEELRKLNEKFVGYQYEIQSNIISCFNKFNQDALLGLLFEKGGIGINYLNQLFNIDLQESQYQFIQFLTLIGTYSRKDIQKIEKEFTEIQELLDKAKKKLKKNSSSMSFGVIFNALGEDFASNLLQKLPFVYKIERMIELSQEIISEKNKIETPINRFLAISNDFITSDMFKDKRLLIAQDGALIINTDNKHSINLNQLSSGEKQLLVLFLRTLLQKNKKGVYITDEPELSLHIVWQKKLIAAIKEINPNVQIIFATHSPDIVANYEIIEMKDIMTNGKKI